MWQEPKKCNKFVLVDSENDVTTEGIVQRIIAHRFVGIFTLNWVSGTAIYCCQNW